MSMFCYQCQETAGNIACKVKGVCGKNDDTAKLQDLLVYTLKGLAIFSVKAEQLDISINKEGLFIAQSLFATITNANFDNQRIISLIKESLALRQEIKEKFLAAYKEKNNKDFSEQLPEVASWFAAESEFLNKAEKVGVLSIENEDLRSLKELVVYGLKGLSAYLDHAAVLGEEDKNIYFFLAKALAMTTEDLTVEQLVALVQEVGENAVATMALLDKANTAAFGNPELSEVNLGVGKNPGILVSGHDLKDMQQLLEQSEGTGVDIYTHCEMLPSHYYPAFKKYKHLVGNYGGSWWNQSKDFSSFNGPILMTTNCITPLKDTYRQRFFTTGMAGYSGVEHIESDAKGKKDFSKIIELAKTCKAPEEIEQGKIVGGFAHHQVLALADKVVAAVKSGAIKRFIVMAGCDGRQSDRNYYTEVAQELPKDTVILTAGCAKYRYNKLDLGDIDGIPRVLDAGQCNDSYSLAVVALKLKEVFELDDINKLPISFDIAWYEQKAVTVLLALLSLGVKGIRLGPTLPAFLSQNVAKVLVENFELKPIGTVRDDVAAMVAGN